MKTYLQLIGLCILFSITSKAQLASWTPGTNPAYTNFPIFNSDQINGFCRISQFKFHASDPNKMYAVTGEGGFFTTIDGGNNWTVKSGTENLTYNCASICIDYTNDQIIYLGTGDANYYSNGAGIYKSTDGGNTFTATSLTNCLVIEILQDPTNSSTFIAATNKGIYKSINNGSTWTATTSTTIEFCDLKKNPFSTSHTLFACTRENSARLFRSFDFGSTWTQITSGITTSVNNVQAGARVGLTLADTNIVYFSTVGGLGIIHKSTDAGSNFTVTKAEGAPNLTGYDTTVASGGGQGNYNNCLAVDQTNPNKIWIQSHSTWRSSTSGTSWTFLHRWPDGIHTDAHQIQQSPFDATKLFACNDGGIWLSTNEGNTWTPKSNGLYAYEVYGETGKSSKTNRNILSIGTQDNGRVMRDGNYFTTIVGGDDGNKREYDYLPNGGNYYLLGNNKRTAALAVRTYSTYGLPASIPSLEAIAFNRTNPNLAFVGKSNIFVTTNLSANTPVWSQISTFTKTIMSIHSCIADANKLYVITSDQKMYVSSNALSPAPTFTQINLPSSSASKATIAAIANNANIVYISIDSKVYVSNNSGSSWTNITYNLPNVNHNRILAEEYGGTQELVFVATNNAVYYKKAGQTTWTNYSTNLPGRRAPTSFSMYDDGTNQALIRYSSYGRGIFETPFDNLREFEANIYINGDSAITCSNTSIQFKDGSVGTINTPLTYSWSFPGGTPSSSTSANQNVVYPTSGFYSITLTITDALSNTSTKTITKYINVISCNPDTIAGSALKVSPGGNYAKTDALALGTTNTITISAWIKIDGTQPDYGGIAMSDNGGNTTGLHFRTGNKLGYHYNGSSASYNYSNGPVVPTGVWTHIALVTTSSNATFYLNGVPTVNALANSPISLNKGFYIGSDRGTSDRWMNGQIDELCIYNRALTQNEIRELMHLTKNYSSIDPNLKAYYQFNEVGGQAYNRAGSENAILFGTAQHIVSSAPVGSGNSERQTITTNGVKNFTNEGISLTFGTGTLPNGEICITRLNTQPDAEPTGVLPTNSSEKYWVINNYGTNTSFTALTNITATGFGNITTIEASTPSMFKMYRRTTGDFLHSTWSLGSTASSATSGTNGVVSFNTTGTTNFNRQFTIIKDIPATYTITATSGANGTISPNGTSVVANGATQTFTITPSSCYQISDVLIDGISVGAVSTYTFNNILANHTIDVSFTLPTNSITASAGTNGSISNAGTTNVTCGASQTYTITPGTCAQITDVLVDGISVGNVSTYTFTNIVGIHTISATFSPQVPCTSDTIPGLALKVNGTSNYAVTPVILLGNTNTITLSAWIKIDVNQPNGAGIVFTGSGGACGLNFWTGNRLGYHFKDAAATYNYIGGPIIPLGQWVHVALVTTANDATLYMNGVPYVNAVANANVDFTSGFNLGNDRGNTARTMNGLMDEVCIYNRALSQNEIRELMHLVRNYPSVDASLKAYYQFNDAGIIIYDKANGSNGTLVGTASLQTSTAPVGSGKSERQTITTSGIKSFTNEGLILDFGTGSLPNGEICVTRLNIQPDAQPTGVLASNASSKYWIINNFGTNSTFTSTMNISATGFGNISAADVLVPTKYKLFDRATGAFASSSWLFNTNATSASAGINGVVNFNNISINSFNKQFTITRDIVYPITATTGSNGTITPNGTTDIINGANQTYSIISNPCYQIDDVIVDGNSQGTISSYTFNNVTSAHSITASFTPITYTITASSNSGGTISPIGTSVVNCGSTNTFTITPNALYAIDQVIVDGNSVGAVASYTFSNINSNHTIDVIFVLSCNTPVFSSSITNVTCNGGNDGAINLSVTSGSSPFTYAWSNGSNAQNISALSAGSYTVTVTATGGCTSSAVYVVTQPTALSPITNTISSCDTYTWSVNGLTFTTSGNYNAQISCQLYILNLTISPSTNSHITINSCLPYTWSANGSTYTTSGIYTSISGCSFDTLDLTIQSGVLVHAKVILSGPYVAALGLMHDSLRVNQLIPFTEPYSYSPYNKIPIGETNGESTTAGVLNVIGNNAIVDWIMIELRSATNPTSVFANKRALIQRDGDIVSTDGISPVVFTSVNTGSYYVSIKHRNHIGVMTNSAMVLNGCSTSLIDFTTIPVYSNPAIFNLPRRLIGTIQTLWSGDANFNKNTKYNGASNDKNAILNSVGISTPNNFLFPVYRAEDLNLDGRVRYNNINNDRLIIFLTCPN